MPKPPPQPPLPPPTPEAPNVHFCSTRDLTLRFVTVVCAIPLPLTLWLLKQAPAEEWRNGPFGPALWWLIPLVLLALAAALPIGLALLHDRYVLKLERTGPALWRLTTFVLWGVRRRELAEDPLHGARIRHVDGQFHSMWAPSVDAPYLKVTTRTGQKLIFDMQGEWNLRKD